MLCTGPNEKTHGKLAALGHLKVPTQGPGGNSPETAERETPGSRLRRPWLRTPHSPRGPLGVRSLPVRGGDRSQEGRTGRSGVCPSLKKSESPLLNPRLVRNNHSPVARHPPAGSQLRREGRLRGRLRGRLHAPPQALPPPSARTRCRVGSVLQEERRRRRTCTQGRAHAGAKRTSLGQLRESAGPGGRAHPPESTGAQWGPGMHLCNSKLPLPCLSRTAGGFVNYAGGGVGAGRAGVLTASSPKTQTRPLDSRSWVFCAYALPLIT